MFMFPVVLNLKNKRAVVFGGGEVAERRVIKLLKAGAIVEVVSRDFTQGLRRLRNPRLKLVSRDLENGLEDLGKYDLVLIATNDRALNDRIESKAREQGRLVNRADKVADFIIPATIEEGDVIISVSTLGRSPGMTKHIKKRLRRALRKEDLLSIELQEYARAELKEKVKNQKDRRGFLRSIMQSLEVSEMLREGDLQGAKELVRRRIDAYSKH